MEKLFFEVTLTMLTKAVGGRSTPIFHNYGHYRPHAVVRDDLEMLGVAFMEGPEQIAPGETVTVQLHAMYHPDVDYHKLAVGTQFIIVEGFRIVAVGLVQRRWCETT